MRFGNSQCELFGRILKRFMIFGIQSKEIFHGGVFDPEQAKAWGKRFAHGTEYMMVKPGNLKILLDMDNSHGIQPEKEKNGAMYSLFDVYHTEQQAMGSAEAIKINDGKAFVFPHTPVDKKLWAVYAWFSPDWDVPKPAKKSVKKVSKRCKSK